MSAMQEGPIRDAQEPREHGGGDLSTESIETQQSNFRKRDQSITHVYIIDHSTGWAYRVSITHIN